MKYSDVILPFPVLVKDKADKPISLRLSMVDSAGQRTDLMETIIPSQGYWVLGIRGIQVDETGGIVMPTAKTEVKELIEDYILILYDIPATAKALRYQFLKNARAMGAEEHTASAYMLPFSEQAMELASKLNSAGHAVVFGPAHQPDKVKASEMTVKYTDAIKARCDNIDQRLDIAQSYIAAGRLEMGNKMAIKTGKLLQQLSKIVENYNPEWLLPRIVELTAKWKEIYGKES